MAKGKLIYKNDIQKVIYRCKDCDFCHESLNCFGPPSYRCTKINYPLYRPDELPDEILDKFCPHVDIVSVDNKLGLIRRDKDEWGHTTVVAWTEQLDNDKNDISHVIVVMKQKKKDIPDEVA